MPEDTLPLGRRLTALGYEALFRGPHPERTLDGIWASAPQEEFERLVGDATASPLARFLGSQVLLRKDMTFLSRMDLHSLSDVYVEALLGNYTGTLSDWGFLHSNDDLGVVGSAFLVFGDRAVDRLVELLSDATVVEYARPAPDVSGFDRTRLQRVRVKDFAALYLSKIRNVQVKLEGTFDERDDEIGKLERALASG
jgi:hypothetical protein